MKFLALSLLTAASFLTSYAHASGRLIDVSVEVTDKATGKSASKTLTQPTEEALIATIPGTSISCNVAIMDASGSIVSYYTELTSKSGKSAVCGNLRMKVAQVEEERDEVTLINEDASCSVTAVPHVDGAPFAGG
jgi:hypothetical protein